MDFERNALYVEQHLESAATEFYLVTSSGRIKKLLRDENKRRKVNIRAFSRRNMSDYLTTLLRRTLGGVSACCFVCQV